MASVAVAPLSRAVLVWLQSLGITPRSPRHDFANGYLVAQIFARHYPQQLSMHSFDAGAALDRRLTNWLLLNNFFRTVGIELDADAIEGTVHGKPGAAEALVEQIYALLNNKEVPPRSHDFTDFAYQTQLPPHARATTISAIKTNLSQSETVARPDEGEQHRRVADIVTMQHTLRTTERSLDPDRFGITLRGPTGHPLPSSTNATTRFTQPYTDVFADAPLSPVKTSTIRVAQSPRPQAVSP